MNGVRPAHSLGSCSVLSLDPVLSTCFATGLAGALLCLPISYLNFFFSVSITFLFMLCVDLGLCFICVCVDIMYIFYLFFVYSYWLHVITFLVLVFY